MNSHGSPYAHYVQKGMERWFNIIKDTGAYLWLNGNTHGENHEYSASLGVHFIDNGAGGGAEVHPPPAMWRTSGRTTAKSMAASRSLHPRTGSSYSGR